MSRTRISQLLLVFCHRASCLFFIYKYIYIHIYYLSICCLYIYIDLSWALWVVVLCCNPRVWLRVWKDAWNLHNRSEIVTDLTTMQWPQQATATTAKKQQQQQKTYRHEMRRSIYIGLYKYDMVFSNRERNELGRIDAARYLSLITTSIIIGLGEKLNFIIFIKFICVYFVFFVYFRLFSSSFGDRCVARFVSFVENYALRLFQFESLKSLLALAF